VCVHLEQPQVSIDAIQYVAIVACTLGVALLADVHHTLATDWSLAAATQCGRSVAFVHHFHSTFDSYQVESWLKTMRLMLELVCLLMMLMFLSVLRTTDPRTVAVISVHSSSF